MIVGGNKDKVIANIKENCNAKELNKKVETDDPVLSVVEEAKILKKFFLRRKFKINFYFKNKIANRFINKLARDLNNSITIEGLDNLKDINSGAIVTSNHFNPLDSLIPRKVIKKRFNKNIYIVSQTTNLAMDGFLGYLFNNLNIFSLNKSPNYIIKTFTPYLKSILRNKKNPVSILQKTGSLSFMREDQALLTSSF